MTNETFYSQLIQIAADTVIKCEKEFGVDIALEKIDFVQMSLASGIAGVEHPGLVTLSPLYSPDFFISVVIHEIVHQWTGVKLLNDWWSGFWINEGLTSYITKKLVAKFNLLGTDEGSVYGGFYYGSGIELHTYQLERGSVYMAGFQSKARLEPTARVITNRVRLIYPKATNAVGLLDLAMDGHLMSCLGEIMKENPYSSITTEEILQKLTDCEYCSLNATWFMHFWVFEEEIPILTVDFEEKAATKLKVFGSYSKPILTFHYTYLRSIKEMNETNAASRSDLKFQIQPKFAVVLRDYDMRVLQDSILVKRNNTKVAATFDLKASTFFMINAVNRGNFIARYPSYTYEAFFDWLEREDEMLSAIDPKNPQRRNYAFFLIDLITVASRELVDSKYLFRLLYNFPTISYMDEVLRRVDYAKIFYKLYDLVHCMACEYPKQLPDYPEDGIQNQRKLLECYLNRLSLTWNCTVLSPTYSFYDVCQNWMLYHTSNFVKDLSAMIKVDASFTMCRNHT